MFPHHMVLLTLGSEIPPAHIGHEFPHHMVLLTLTYGKVSVVAVERFHTTWFFLHLRKDYEFFKYTILFPHHMVLLTRDENDR